MNKVFIAIIFLMLSSGQNIFAVELNELLKKMVSTPVKFARFKETQTAYFLDGSLISEGTLEFRAPETMIKRLTHPETIEQRIEGDVLSIYKNKKKRKSILLSTQPEFSAGINAIRWTLSGNMAALNHNFEITFVSHESDWRIDLIPKDPNVHSQLANIVLTGKDDRITRIIIKQANGDSITTVLYEHR